MIPQGQLSKVERDYLYKITTEIRPNIVLESGTWYGGGSTYAIYKALRDMRYGMLLTYESCERFWKIANDFYADSPFIMCLNLEFTERMEKADGDPMWNDVGMVFLDGGDEDENGKLKLPEESYPEASENLAAFKIIERNAISGTHVLCHDWNINGGRGTFIKSYLQSTNYEGWTLTKVIPETTGLAHLIRK